MLHDHDKPARRAARGWHSLQEAEARQRRSLRLACLISAGAFVHATLVFCSLWLLASHGTADRAHTMALGRLPALAAPATAQPAWPSPYLGKATGITPEWLLQAQLRDRPAPRAADAAAPWEPAR